MSRNDTPTSIEIAIIGAGPAGLMAAEVLSAQGREVHLYDAMPSPARKFLRAGIGGLNLTHAQPLAKFLDRYGPDRPLFARLLNDFGPRQIQDWARSLGIDTFVGSSGRVFPTAMKGAPLLRAWLRRLEAQGCVFHPRHRWLGWNGDGALRLLAPDGETVVAARACLLALGGGSWPQLGSDGAWTRIVEAEGIAVAPLAPSNCGFDADWSDHFRTRFARTPLKPVVVTVSGRSIRGELMITETGLEGGPIYALSAPLREAVAATGKAVAILDLKPDWSEDRLRQALAKPRGSRSLSSHLERQARLGGAIPALLRETAPPDGWPERDLAMRLKALPVTLCRPRPLAEAISSAGGVRFDAVDDDLMLRQRPGTFVAGEMLDWEAPTGGYLLTACLSLGRHAAAGIVRYLNRPSK